MTDTPTQERDPAAGDVAAGDDAAAPVPATSGAVSASKSEPTPFWQRRYVEKFLVPLVLPIAVIIGLVTYVLNLSRIFLSGHGHIPVIVGSVILVVILVGAALSSAASPRLRQSAITLISAGFILSIMMSGWLVLGSAQPKETGPTTLPTTLKTDQTFPVTAAPGGALKFAPDALKTKTGLVRFDVTVAAPGHTFTLKDPTTLMESLSLNAAGSKVSAVAFFAKAGTYEYFCAIPGHEPAGMKGTITVTGPETTLDAALKASGNPPSAAG